MNERCNSATSVNNPCRVTKKKDFSLLYERVRKARQQERYSQLKKKKKSICVPCSANVKSVKCLLRE